MRGSNLSKATTLKSIGKLVAVSAVAGLLVFLTADAPKAGADVTGAQVQRAAKGERLPVFVKGTACSTRGWPHYEQRCLFDDRGSADDVRAVRVIALR
jgi:hypothetical protein